MKMQLSSRFVLAVVLLNLGACASAPPRTVVSPDMVQESLPSAPAVPEAVVPVVQDPAPSVSAVEPDKAVEQSPVPPVTVKTRIKPDHSYVNVRPTPGSENRPVALLRKGDAIEVVDESGQWLKVQWQKKKWRKEGWVHRRFVEGYTN